MKSFLLWWLFNTISLFVVAELLPGVEVREGVGTLLLVALIIGLVNAVLRPILYLASCGFIILTLGLIIPVLNALLLMLADELAGRRFEIDGFLWAIAAAILMGIINSVLHHLVKEDDSNRKESYVIQSK
ncbi:MAG: phage holin family protein [Deltaproteobacteria bacterium]|nr:phage holin family protein [Candidatus Kapabacteria bacterium]